MSIKSKTIVVALLVDVVSSGTFTFGNFVVANVIVVDVCEMKIKNNNNIMPQQPEALWKNVARVRTYGRRY